MHTYVGRAAGWSKLFLPPFLSSVPHLNVQNPFMLGRSFVPPLIFFCASFPQQRSKSAWGSRIIFFFPDGISTGDAFLKQCFPNVTFLWIALFVAPRCLPGHSENETFFFFFFQEFYPAVNIYIDQVAVKTNNFLISNAPCRSQIISPVALSGTPCTWCRGQEKRFWKKRAQD